MYVYAYEEYVPCMNTVNFERNYVFHYHHYILCFTYFEFFKRLKFFFLLFSNTVQLFLDTTDIA